MTQPRVYGNGETIYHCMSRIVDKRFIFGEAEKEWFLNNIRKLEQFTGCTVLSYCIMSNHFHVLVHVPDADTTYIDDAGVLKRIEGFYGRSYRHDVEEELAQAKKQKWSKTATSAVLDRYRKRMHSISCFIQGVKQRFSHWYNKQMNRVGTLWESRFKSVIVQGAGEPLLTMAAYIELNPVRAGMVEDPTGYRWNSFGAAFGGCQAARRGIRSIFKLLGLSQSACAWRRSSREYRKLVIGVVGERGVTEDSPEISGLNIKSIKREIPQQRIDAALAGSELLSPAELLRCHSRYFTYGMVIGTKEFVEDFFQCNRNRFSERRKNGARKMRGGFASGEKGLFAARDLVRSPISEPDRHSTNQQTHKLRTSGRPADW